MDFWRPSTDLALISDTRGAHSSRDSTRAAAILLRVPQPQMTIARAINGRGDKIKSREMPDKPKGAGVRRSSDAEFSRGQPQPFVCWRNATTDFSSFSTDEWRSPRLLQVAGVRWLNR